MFFVCYVILARKNVVFPMHWFKDHNLLMVKYINQRLNSNQRLLAYYSGNSFNQIENGLSPNEFQPNFDLSMDVSFPEEGCYFVLPKKCFETLNEAIIFANSRRNIRPALYNESREYEHPIPNVSQTDGNGYEVHDQ